VCTLILLHRPEQPWPVLLAANRDEMLARPWQSPAEHWPELPGVIGGRDTLAGGTWLAINRHNMVAGVLNRTGSLGPLQGKRSRGELPLRALRHATAQAAADEAAMWDGGQWRSFNLIVADPAHAFFICGLGHGTVQAIPLRPGLSITTASDPNDPAHPRVARHRAAFQAALPPDPPDWKSWPALLADSEGAWEETLNVPLREGFGTASAALIGLKPDGAIFQFAPGAPGQTEFQAVLF
jgi:uncharacterized protein with NRDE domain